VRQNTVFSTKILKKFLGRGPTPEAPRPHAEILGTPLTVAERRERRS